MKLAKNKNGFSLVEISIVLFVVSILIAVTIKAKTLKYSSEASFIISEQTKLRQAFVSFYETYSALPGNFNSAFYTFNTGANQTTILGGSASIDIINNASFDGSGNRMVNNTVYKSQNSSAGTKYYTESLQAWKHLGAAGIIDNIYNGVCGNSASCITVGINIPKCGLQGTNAGYNIFYPDSTNFNTTHGAIINNTKFFKTNITNVLELADFTTQSAVFTRGLVGAISPEITSILDAKIDDGKPLSGAVIGLNDNSNACHNGSNAIYSTTATYLLGSNKTCIIDFILSENG